MVTITPKVACIKKLKTPTHFSLAPPHINRHNSLEHRANASQRYRRNNILPYECESNMRKLKTGVNYIKPPKLLSIF